MKTSLKFLIIPVVLITVAMSSPQDLLRLNYRAYLNADKEIWKSNVALASKIYQDDPSVDNLFNLAQTEYGLLNISMKDEDEKMFDDYVDNCEAHLEDLLESKKYGADAKALLSSVFGFKMAYSTWKSMVLGPKSSKLLDQAVAENPNSPIVLKMLASNKYFTPAMWGGDVDKSLELFQKSSRLFAASGTESNWMHLDNLAWEGIILTEQGRTQEAKKVYQKALELEPDFYWVREGLLPAID
ncbi:tetratricopeptide repeat protein [Algoriphagus namhaensis]